MGLNKNDRPVKIEEIKSSGCMMHMDIDIYGSWYFVLIVNFSSAEPLLRGSANFSKILASKFPESGPDRNGGELVAFIEKHLKRKK